MRCFSAVGGNGKGHWMSEVALGGHYSEECSTELGQGLQFHSPVALQPSATLHGKFGTINFVLYSDTCTVSVSGSGRKIFHVQSFSCFEFACFQIVSGQNFVCDFVLFPHFRVMQSI